ncbi:MAG: AraC family transcriptional regulator [Victivallaceae bacterium]|nr:AraC family transcriptional regulator [Victivallaceae bacterium]
MNEPLATIKRNLFFDEEFPLAVICSCDSSRKINDSIRFRREFWKIAFIAAGDGELLLGRAAYPIQPGTVMLIHPGARTTYRMKQDSIVVYNIVFDPKIIFRELKELPDKFRFFSIFDADFRQEEKQEAACCYVHAASHAAGQTVKALYREYEKNQSNRNAMLKLKLLELLILLSREGEKNLRMLRHEAIVDYVDRMLEEHFREPLSVANLAASVGVTPNHLSRVYRAVRQGGIAARLKMLRLTAATQELKRGNRSIFAIANRCGFNDLSYFHRAFFATFHCTPGEYRNEPVSCKKKETGVSYKKTMSGKGVRLRTPREGN